MKDEVVVIKESERSNRVWKSTKAIRSEQRNNATWKSTKATKVPF